jgi:hypothetical protein
LKLLDDVAVGEIKIDFGSGKPVMTEHLLDGGQ